MPEVSETGRARDILGRTMVIGHDEDAVFVDDGWHRLLFEAAEREQFMKAWAEAERRAEAHGAVT